MKKKRLVGKIAEEQKKKVRRKAKKKRKRILRGIFCGAALFSLGIFVGVHRRVILAYLKGEELPEAPKSHCCHK